MITLTTGPQTLGPGAYQEACKGYQPKEKLHEEGLELMSISWTPKAVLHLKSYKTESSVLIYICNNQFVVKKTSGRAETNLP
jgi:hypothetical protein